MKCKICGREIAIKEIKEKTICEFDNFFRIRKVVYKQEVIFCPYCKYENIEPKFYNTKKTSSKRIKKNTLG